MNVIYNIQPTAAQEQSVAKNDNMLRLLQNFNRIQSLRTAKGERLLELPTLTYSYLGNGRTSAVFSFKLFGRIAKVALAMLIDGTVVHTEDNTQVFFVG